MYSCNEFKTFRLFVHLIDLNVVQCSISYVEVVKFGKKKKFHQSVKFVSTSAIEHYSSHYHQAVLFPPPCLIYNTNPAVPFCPLQSPGVESSGRYRPTPCPASTACRVPAASPVNSRPSPTQRPRRRKRKKDG